MGIIIEIDGTDGTGKTSVTRDLCAELLRRGYAAQRVPPSRELMQRFLQTFEASDDIDRVGLEATGFAARRSWAGRYRGFCLIDRGSITLMASSVARLRLTGMSEMEAERTVSHAFESVHEQSHVRYLLDTREPVDGLSLFWEREPERVSPHYFEYQAAFLATMSQEPRAQWRRVFDARQDLESTVDAIATDLIRLAFPLEES